MVKNGESGKNDGQLHMSNAASKFSFDSLVTLLDPGTILDPMECIKHD